MIEEKKKEAADVKRCGECLDFRGEHGPFRKLFGFSLFGMALGFCLCVLLCVHTFSLQGGGGRTFLFAFAVIAALAFATVYLCTNVIGRYLYGFYAKDEKWHLHAKSVPYVVTKMYASGPTKDYCDRDYYYIPSNMAGSKEELFSKFGIDRPILRISDGGWFRSYAILSSGTTRYNDWRIDRARLLDGQLTVRLRYKLRDDTAMIVTPEEAIRIIETCNDQVGTKSLATYLLDQMEHRKIMLGYAKDDMHSYEKVAETWQKHAVAGWSRVFAISRMLTRLEQALFSSKKTSKSMVGGDARLAIERIKGSELFNYDDYVQGKALCTELAGAEGKAVELVSEFDHGAGMGISMLNPKWEFPVTSPLAPASIAQQA